VDVCVDIARGAPSVLVDILQIEQVLLNLIRNSIDAIRHNAQVGGTIVIEARRADDAFIEARITDSGPGFSREYLESGILSLSSSRAKGLGIGLPLSRSIIEAHRGRLWLDAASRLTPPYPTRAREGFRTCGNSKDRSSGADDRRRPVGGHGCGAAKRMAGDFRDRRSRNSGMLKSSGMGGSKSCRARFCDGANLITKHSTPSGLTTSRQPGSVK
jgi:signal transduction histidine kinase